MARMDHAQPIGGVVEGVEQRIVMQAGQGIDRVEAMADQNFSIVASAVVIRCMRASSTSLHLF